MDARASVTWTAINLYSEEDNLFRLKFEMPLRTTIENHREKVVAILKREQQPRRQDERRRLRQRRKQAAQPQPRRQA